jgi:hypothetical protein
LAGKLHGTKASLDLCGIAKARGENQVRDDRWHGLGLAGDR